MPNGYQMVGGGAMAYIGSTAANGYGFAAAGFISTSTVAGTTNSGTTSTRWLPDFDVPVVDIKTGKVTPSWGWWFNEVANRLGGQQGPSLPAVASDASTAVQTATQNASDVGAIVQTVNSNVAATQAITQVALRAELAGANQIPPVTRVEE